MVWILIILIFISLAIYLYKKLNKNKINSISIPSIPLEITLLESLKSIEKKNIGKMDILKNIIVSF